MKLFFSFILFCFSLVFVVSCKSRKPPEPVTIETTKTITEVVKDTVFKVEADSAFYYAWIDCQNGKPVISPLTHEGGTKKNEAGLLNSARNDRSLQTPKVKMIGNRLEVECYQEALNIFKSWKEKYITENQKTTVPVYVEKPFRWYHKALMWTGGISLLLLAVGLSLKFIKPL